MVGIISLMSHLGGTHLGHCRSTMAPLHPWDRAGRTSPISTGPQSSWHPSLPQSDRPQGSVERKPETLGTVSLLPLIIAGRSVAVMNLLTHPGIGKPVTSSPRKGKTKELAIMSRVYYCNISIHDFDCSQVYYMVLCGHCLIWSLK